VKKKKEIKQGARIFSSTRKGKKNFANQAALNEERHFHAFSNKDPRKRPGEENRRLSVERP